MNEQQKEPATNADCIRSMSDEELVSFLCVDNCNYCVYWNAAMEHCTDQKSKKKPTTQGCAEGHRQWLLHPKDGGTGNGDL